MTKSKDTLGITIGKILCAQRERLNKTQREIADILGYKNSSFIAMVEKGRSNVPLKRVQDFLSTYKLPAEFGIIIIKEAYPDRWKVLAGLLGDSEFVNSSYEDINVFLEDMLNELKMELKIK